MASLSSRSLSSSEVSDCILVNCTGVCWYDPCVPPPPPLSPNVSVPSDPDSTPIEIHHPSRLLPNFLIAAGALLGLSFFLLLLLSFAVHRRRRRRRRQQELDGTGHYPPPPENDAGVPDLVDDEDDGAPHHIWYIRTVGLDESVIKSIAATVYRSKDGLIDGGDCSVCLGEFSDGEAIKLLPKCAHAFHLSCIDTWLRSHVNCPLCRAPVVALAVAGPAESDDSSPSVSASVQISIPNQEECVIALDEGAGSSSVSRGEEEMQPVRRSVSMDYSALGMLMLGIESESEEKMGEERKYHEFEGAVVPKNIGKWGEVLGKRGVEMKRSLSSRSGRLFFQRYARGRSASVLPL